MSPLKPGTKLEITRTCEALSGHTYLPGMILELVEPTQAAPFGFRSPLGNWIVKCPFQTSVWSSVWIGVDQGWFRIRE